MNTANLPQAYLDYLHRIGAEVLNFRRAMVKERHGTYYTERAIIQLTEDGTIKVSSEDPALAERCQPTAEEQAATIEGMKGVAFPKSINAPAASFEEMVRANGIDRSTIWPLINQRDRTVRMAQQRIDLGNGEKKFMPWSFWSDGIWRRMEPSGAVIPFWKPEQEVSHKIMLHEGAKAAAYAHRLTTALDAAEARAQHPWSNDLAEYEHWGLIGGALAAHRADYQELLDRKATEVVMFCDNDDVGRSALKTVARNYRGLMRGIYVLDRIDFKVGWDIADPMPEHKFNRHGRWQGAELKELMFPATWATEIIPGTEDKPKFRISREFLKDWCYIIKPEIFINQMRPGDHYTEKEFNNKVQCYSDVKETSKLMRNDDTVQATRMIYNPGKKPGFITDDSAGGQTFNSYNPSRIEAKQGNVAPFLEYIEHLFPVEDDRIEVLRWCATLVLRPDIKMRYGLLLFSEVQGVGKTTLGEKILRPLLGVTNVSCPSERTVVDSQFNTWAAHKQLAVVNEIYAGQSAKAYNALKSIITEDTIDINQKHQTPYTIDNYLHFFACSNSSRALKISLEDRRFLVPKVREEKRPMAYWDALNRWLVEEEGLEKIKWWLKEDFLKRYEPVGNGDAPNTRAKRAMVEEQLSPGLELVFNVLTLIQQKTEDGKFIIPDRVLVSVIKQHIYDGRQSDRLEKPATIRQLAKMLGWFASESKVRFGMDVTHYLTNKEELIGLGNQVKEANGIVLLDTYDKLVGLQAKDGSKIIAF